MDPQEIFSRAASSQGNSYTRYSDDPLRQKLLQSRKYPLKDDMITTGSYGSVVSSRREQPSEPSTVSHTYEPSRDYISSKLDASASSFRRSGYNDYIPTSLSHAEALSHVWEGSDHDVISDKRNVSETRLYSATATPASSMKLSEFDKLARDLGYTKSYDSGSKDTDYRIVSSSSALPKLDADLNSAKADLISRSNFKESTVFDRHALKSKDDVEPRSSQGFYAKQKDLDIYEREKFLKERSPSPSQVTRRLVSDEYSRTMPTHLLRDSTAHGSKKDDDEAVCYSWVGEYLDDESGDETPTTGATFNRSKAKDVFKYGHDDFLPKSILKKAGARGLDEFKSDRHEDLKRIRDNSLADRNLYKGDSESIVETRGLDFPKRSSLNVEEDSPATSKTASLHHVDDMQGVRIPVVHGMRILASDSTVPVVTGARIVKESEERHMPQMVQTKIGDSCSQPVDEPIASSVRFDKRNFIEGNKAHGQQPPERSPGKNSITNFQNAWKSATNAFLKETKSASSKRIQEFEGMPLDVGYNGVPLNNRGENLPDMPSKSDRVEQRIKRYSNKADHVPSRQQRNDQEQMSAQGYDDELRSEDIVKRPKESWEMVERTNEKQAYGNKARYKQSVTRSREHVRAVVSNTDRDSDNFDGNLGRALHSDPDHLSSRKYQSMTRYSQFNNPLNVIEQEERNISRNIHPKFKQVSNEGRTSEERYQDQLFEERNRKEDRQYRSTHSVPDVGMADAYHTPGHEKSKLVSNSGRIVVPGYEGAAKEEVVPMTRIPFADTRNVYSTNEKRNLGLLPERQSDTSPLTGSAKNTRLVVSRQNEAGDERDSFADKRFAEHSNRTAEDNSRKQKSDSSWGAHYIDWFTKHILGTSLFREFLKQTRIIPSSSNISELPLYFLRNLADGDRYAFECIPKDEGMVKELLYFLDRFCGLKNVVHTLSEMLGWGKVTEPTGDTIFSRSDLRETNRKEDSRFRSVSPVPPRENFQITVAATDHLKSHSLSNSDRIVLDRKKIVEQPIDDGETARTVIKSIAQKGIPISANQEHTVRSQKQSVQQPAKSMAGFKPRSVITPSTQGDFHVNINKNTPVAQINVPTTSWETVHCETNVKPVKPQSKGPKGKFLSIQEMKQLAAEKEKKLGAVKGPEVIHLKRTIIQDSGNQVQKPKGSRWNIGAPKQSRWNVKEQAENQASTAAPPNRSAHHTISKNLSISQSELEKTYQKNEAAGGKHAAALQSSKGDLARKGQARNVKNAVSVADNLQKKSPAKNVTAKKRDTNNPYKWVKPGHDKKVSPKPHSESPSTNIGSRDDKPGKKRCSSDKSDETQGKMARNDKHSHAQSAERHPSVPRKEKTVTTPLSSESKPQTMDDLLELYGVTHKNLMAGTPIVPFDLNKMRNPNNKWSMMITDGDVARFKNYLRTECGRRLEFAFKFECYPSGIMNEIAFQAVGEFRKTCWAEKHLRIFGKFHAVSLLKEIFDGQYDKQKGAANGWYKITEKAFKTFQEQVFLQCEDQLIPVHYPRNIVFESPRVAKALHALEKRYPQFVGDVRPMMSLWPWKKWADDELEFIRKDSKVDDLPSLPDVNEKADVKVWLEKIYKKRPPFKNIKHVNEEVLKALRSKLGRNGDAIRLVIDWWRTGYFELRHGKDQTDDAESAASGAGTKSAKEEPAGEKNERPNSPEFSMEGMVVLDEDFCVDDDSEQQQQDGSVNGKPGKRGKDVERKPDGAASRTPAEGSKDVIDLTDDLEEGRPFEEEYTEDDTGVPSISLFH